MSHHDRFQELLARRAELNPGEEERLRQHLAACPDCRERAAAYQRQRELLRSLPLAQPPPALRADVLRRVHQPRPARQRPWRWPLLLAPLAAALVVAIVVTAHLMHPSARTASPALHVLSPAPSAQVQPTVGARGAGPARHPSVPSSTTIPRTRQTPIRHRQPPTAPHSPRPTASAPGNPVPGPIVSQRLPVATPTSLPVAALAPPLPSPTPPPVAAPAGVASGAQRPISQTSPVRRPESTGHRAPATPRPSPTPVPPTPVLPTPVPPTGTPVPAPPLIAPVASPTVVVETPLPAPNRAVPAEAPPVLPSVPRKPFPPLPIFLPPTFVPFPTPTP